MMHWRDVNYLCHGLEAEVIMEAAAESSASGQVVLRSIHGVIECPRHDDIPRLRTIRGDTGLALDDALVLLVPRIPRTAHRKLPK